MSCTASASTATPTRFLHRWAARAFYAAFQQLSGTALPEGAGDFRLLDRKAVDAMNRMRERVRFNKGLFAWMGFRSIGVPFHVPAAQRAALALAAAPAAALRHSTASPRSRPSRSGVVLPRADHLAVRRSATPWSSW